MKTPHLLASLAVAATAAAADLKDPTEVARAWNESSVQPLPIASGDLSLRGTSVPPLRIGPMHLRAPQDKSNSSFQVPPWSKPVPRERGHDAPNYRVPGTLPDNMPPGTKAWEYGGQTYWLLPLIPSRNK